MFKEIKNKLYDELLSIDSIGQVKDYAEIGKDSYPLVLFEPYAGNNKTITAKQIEKEFKFKIYIFQEYENIEKQQAWEILMDVYDDIIEKLNGNLLNNTCNNISIENSEFGTSAGTEDGKTVYGILYISIKVLDNLV